MGGSSTAMSVTTLNQPTYMATPGISTPAATTTFAPFAVRSTSVVPLPVAGYAAAPALPTTTSMMATPHAQQPAMAGYDPAAYGAYGANSGYPTGPGQQYAQPGQQYAQPGQQYAEYPQGTQYPQDQYGAQYGTQYPQDAQYTQPTHKKKKSGCC